MTDEPLTCPDCMSRIGNNRGSCLTCNRFSQAVLRTTRARLKQEYPHEYERIRAEVERDLYHGTIRTETEAQRERTSVAV